MIQTKNETSSNSTQPIVNKVFNPEDKITYHYVEYRYSEIGHFRRHPCGIGWLYTSYATGLSSSCISKKRAIAAIINLWNAQLIPNLEHSKPQQIMIKCLKVDEYLKTMYKALIHDGDSIGDFENHYSELVAKAIEINWDIHTLNESISHDDFVRTLNNSK